jgi:2,4-dienoyl-CoA reductase-like NADH-dependent reductase (Old Yellow Enzyme family)
MTILFEPTRIKNMELRNRFIRSATFDSSSNETGQVSEKQIEMFNALSQGGVGLIITGITYVHSSGQRFQTQNSVASDDCISGLRKLTSSVHHRGAKIALQLFHAGREGANFQKSKNKQAIAPSFVHGDPYFKGSYRSMTEDEIWEVVRAFGDAARRAREAEFDAVQLHGAHGYLLSQFLSLHTNQRQDGWGGDLERRLRFHREVYIDIRRKVGEDYPVLIKIGVQDGFSGGLELREGEMAAQRLAELGFDALEISLGLRGESYEGSEFRTKIDNVNREGYFRDWCKRIKPQVDVPVIMVGGLRTFELMEEVIRKGEADFVSLSRPLIREPNLISDWKSGNYHRTACISCNRCLEAVRKGEPLHCGQVLIKH